MPFYARMHVTTIKDTCIGGWWHRIRAYYNLRLIGFFSGVLEDVTSGAKVVLGNP